MVEAGEQIALPAQEATDITMVAGEIPGATERAEREEALPPTAALVTPMDPVPAEPAAATVVLLVAEAEVVVPGAHKISWVGTMATATRAALQHRRGAMPGQEVRVKES